MWRGFNSEIIEMVVLRNELSMELIAVVSKI